MGYRHLIYLLITFLSDPQALITIFDASIASP